MHLSSIGALREGDPAPAGSDAKRRGTVASAKALANELTAARREQEEGLRTSDETQRAAGEDDLEDEVESGATVKSPAAELLDKVR